MGEVPHHNHTRIPAGGADLRAVHFESVHLPDGAVGYLHRRIVGAPQRIQQRPLGVPGVQRRHAQARLLEAPGLRKLRHLAQGHPSQVARVATTRAAGGGEAHPHATVGFHVGPVGTQTIVAHHDVLGNAGDQVVVQLPGRIRLVCAGKRNGPRRNPLRAAVFLGATHGFRPFSDDSDPTFRALLLSTHPTELFSLVNHFTS